MAAMDIFTYHPFKAIYVLVVLSINTVRFPFWLLYWTSKSRRPNQQWTMQQAVKNHIIKTVMYHFCVVKPAIKLPLEPGKEGARFVVAAPASQEYYKGPLADRDIRPEKCGATWYPERFVEEKDASKTVILHFHGGAYVIGDGRDEDMSWAANNLIKTTGHKVLAVQYRLSSNAGGRFPAALQDAVTLYKYLLDLGVPASQVIVSGDSAGGNLCLALLRYIAEHGNMNGSELLPSPGGCLLWSPWVDLANASAKTLAQSPHEGSDFIPGTFTEWGVSTFVPKDRSASDPYISPLHNAFATKTPIWIQTGSAEVLYFDNLKLAEQLKAVEENDVDLHVVPNASHDIFLVGHKTAFEEESRKAVTVAGQWLNSKGL